MNSLLIFFGRIAIIAGSVVLIVGGYAIGGGMRGHEGAIIGAVLGLIAAGSVFGVAAAIFDAQRSLNGLLAIAEKNAGIIKTGFLS